MLKAIAIGVLWASAIASCAHWEGPAYWRLGVTPSGSSVTIRYLACPGEEVRSVSIYQLDGVNDFVDDDDVPLWQKRGPELDSLGEAGLVPTIDGEPLEMKSDVLYWIDVDTSDGGADTNGLAKSDLQLNRVRANFKNLSEEEFVQNASNSCD